MNQDNDDPEERARVYGKLAPLIMAYYHEDHGRSFHADDLLLYVLDYVPDVAPDSPGRILRQLRQEGKLYYVVINRRESLYQFRPLGHRNRKPSVDDLFEEGTA